MTFAVKGGSFLQYILFLQDVNVGEQGEDIVSKLNGILAREGNIEKILKASEDREYRKVLLREYKLI